MQGDTVKKENINPVDYYRYMRRKDKTKFADYISKKYDINRYVLMQKLCGYYNTHLDKFQIEVIQNEIKEGKWKNWNLETVRTE